MLNIYWIECIHTTLQVDMIGPSAKVPGAWCIHICTDLFLFFCLPFAEKVLSQFHLHFGRFIFLLHSCCVFYHTATAYNTGKHQHRASRHYCGLWKWAYLLITPTILSFVSVPRSDLVSQHENCGGGYISTILVQTYIVHMNIYIYSHSYWRAEQLSSNTVRCSRVKWSHYAKTRRLDSIVATERQNRDRKSVMDLSQRMRKRKMVGRVGTLGNILCADCSCAWENVYRFVSVFISCSINFEFRLFHQQFQCGMVCFHRIFIENIVFDWYDHAPWLVSAVAKGLHCIWANIVQSVIVHSKTEVTPSIIQCIQNSICNWIFPYICRYLPWIFAIFTDYFVASFCQPIFVSVFLLFFFMYHSWLKFRFNPHTNIHILFYFSYKPIDGLSANCMRQRQWNIFNFSPCFLHIFFLFLPCIQLHRGWWP